MTHLVTAVDYLRNPEKFAPAPVVILFGDEPFLRSEVFKVFRDRLLGEEDAEFSLTVYDGGSARFSDVFRELSTRPMFGGSVRLVRIVDADPFVSESSAQLEDYLDAPVESGILLLQMKTLASTTRLYKKMAQKGLLVDSRLPDIGALSSWLRDWAKKRHNISMTSNAAPLLIDLIGSEPGILDSELARLVLLAPADGKITPEFVSLHVGSWRLRKVWDLVDAVLAGNLPEGLRQLDLLLASGETPIGIVAQMSPTLRKLAAATLFYLDAERNGRRITVADAVRAAKFPPFILEKAGDQMKRLGRARGEKLPGRLLQIDLDMKGATRVNPRTVLEEFLVELAGEKGRSPR